MIADGGGWGKKGSRGRKPRRTARQWRGLAGFNEGEGAIFEQGSAISSLACVPDLLSMRFHAVTVSGWHWVTAEY
jgi:hypothetical protein